MAEPFELQSDIRGEEYRRKLQQQLDEEHRQEEEARHFHGRPIPHVAPFHPKKSTKPMTQTDPVTLHSTERAAVRHQFDEKIRQREQEQSHLHQQWEQEQKVTNI